MRRFEVEIPPETTVVSNPEKDGQYLWVKVEGPGGEVILISIKADDDGVVADFFGGDSLDEVLTSTWALWSEAGAEKE